MMVEDIIPSHKFFLTDDMNQGSSDPLVLICISPISIRP